MECDSMRAFVVALVFTACDVGPRPASYNPHGLTGIEVTSEPASDPETPRLDLAAVDTTTGGEVSTSTGASTGGAPLDLGGLVVDLGGGDTSTSDAGSTTGSESTGSSGSSSTGEPEPADFCGDGQCTGAETEPSCWGPGFCPGDCLKQPKCLSDCPCAPGINSFCQLLPQTCSAVDIGGYCDPNGDGQFQDGDWTKGNLEHVAKCG
jgi:hypothetical protein